jgi:hypothetical protein
MGFIWGKSIDRVLSRTFYEGHWRRGLAKGGHKGLMFGVLYSGFSIRGFGNVFFENLLTFFSSCEYHRRRDLVKAIGEGHR